MRRAWAALPWCFATALLMGCATESIDTGQAIQASLEQNRASLGAVAGEAPAPPDSPSRPPVAMPAPAIIVPNVVVMAPVAAGSGGVETAAALIGAEPAMVIRSLGAPRIRRRDGPSEVWLFSGPQCHLDVIFYAEGGGDLRVAHAEARADGTAQRTEAECLAGIARPGV